MSVEKHKGVSPTIGQQVFIADSADVIGKVTLAEDASVWNQAVVRGDVESISIGKRTNIQDGSVLHVTHDGPFSPGGSPLIIGDDVTVGHQVTLHACTIDNECLIGMGAIVLDKAHIQPKTFIGAGSLVPQNKVLESGYLWLGNPVKKIRPLTDDEIAFFAYSAKHYVKLKNEYLDNS